MAKPAEVVDLFAARRPEKPAFRSPDGTYEKIRKSVLEDPSFTLAEFRVLMYAATKPENWVLSGKQLAAATGLSGERVRLALRGLRKKGYVAVVTIRDDRQRYQRRVSYLQRHKVIAGGAGR